MLNFLVRRIGIAIPVVFGIMLLGFAFVHLLPGDPVQLLISPDQLAGPDSAAYLARARQELGLDQTLPVQFLVWAKDVFQGNLGISYAQRVPVTEMLAPRWSATATLALSAVCVALLLGIPVGVIAALRQNTWVDYVSATVSMLAISIPVFFLGLIAIYVFAVLLGVLPSGGQRTLGDTSAVDALRHLVLPACTLAAVLVGPFVRYTRASLLDVLRQDFITTAVAKGVPGVRIVVSHALRNALIPLVTVLAVQVPALLAGTVITETIFSWPGLGKATLDAIGQRDYPVILAVVLLSAGLVMVFNLLADIAAALLDPRIRL
ncbi:ABC transporter permease [Lapillicoccus sp.]|uniref:ABC transporter permease n=1 Tax=Lapillicoccus sp. TaxID=1909287 RepID=UPI0032657554